MMRGDGKKRVTRRERFLGEMDVAARSKLAKRGAQLPLLPGKRAPQRPDLDPYANFDHFQLPIDGHFGLRAELP